MSGRNSTMGEEARESSPDPNPDPMTGPPRFGSPDPLPPTSDISDVALDAAQSDMPSDDAAQWTDGMFSQISMQNPET